MSTETETATLANPAPFDTETFTLARKAGAADAALVDRIRTASAQGKDAQDSARHACVVGFVAGRLNLTRPSAEKIVSKSKGERSPDETRAYDAARKGWSRVLAAAGVTSLETRGGANNPGKAKDADGAKAPTTRNASTGKESTGPATERAQAITNVEQTFASAPEVKVPADAVAFLRTGAAAMLAYMNRCPRAFTTDLRDAVTAFVKAIDAADERLKSAA